MAIKIRKKEEAQEVAQLDVKEPEVVAAGESEADVKIPEMNDKFLMSSGSVVAWLMKNRRLVTFFVIVIVVACLAIIGYFKIVENGMIVRSSGLDAAFTTLAAPTEDQAAQEEAYREAALARQGISAQADEILRYSYKVPDDAKRFEVVENYLNDTVPKFAGEDLEAAASLLQAGVAMRRNNLEIATAAYDRAAAGNDDVRLFALLGQAETLVQNKKFDEAVAKYNEIANLSSGYASFAILSQAQIYELKGDKEKAVASYVRVIRDYGQQNDHAVAQARLRMLTPDWQKLIIQNGAAAPEAAPAAQDQLAAPSEQAPLAPAAGT